MAKPYNLCTFNALKLLLLLALTIFLPEKAKAQQFYVADSQGLLWQVTINANGLTTSRLGGCGSFTYFSIAVSKNKLYYNTVNGVLYSADITGTTPSTVTNCASLTSNIYPNSLTIDNNGVLYYVDGNNLYSIDPKNPIPAFIGTAPYSSAGDLIFYNNELFMASYQGIVKIPVNNPAASTLFIPIPNQVIYALATVSTSSGTQKVYALTASGNSTSVLELDMANQGIVGSIGILPFTAYDAGSPVEAGTVPAVEVIGADIVQECNVFNKAQVQINCKASNSTYTYALSNGLTNTTGLFDNIDPGIYTVRITSSGPESPAALSVTVSDFTLNNPVISVTKTNPVCDIAGKIKLDAGAANATYQIKFGGGIFAFDHVFTGLNAGTYHFTILKPDGCIADEKDYTLLQDVCPPIIIDSVVIKPECSIYGQGSVTVYTKTHPDNYTYNFNNLTNTTGIFNFIPPGNYTLTVNSSGGDTKTQRVIVPDFTLAKPAFSYAVKSAVCTLLGEVRFAINGDGMGASSIKFGSNFYSFSETIPGLIPGSNHFTIYNKSNCIIDELDIYVKLEKCQPVRFPNTFTPNHDGINDIFRANQDSDPRNYKLQVYNRWGQLIFTSTSLYEGWTGEYNGSAAPAGVYYWIASYYTADGKSNLQRGYITLIK